MSAKTIMIQGTGSGVGKSICVAALCRILKQDGLSVAPFKAQNMSLNSFVTKEGLEMGRAQVYQAQAAGLQPDVTMNPVLLKPSGDNLSQVIVMGKPIGNRDARGYYRDDFRAEVKAAFETLAKRFDLVVLEGAGSPAEINLKDKDFVNMWMAKQARSPVVIVGDIDKGGVFAWMKGTFELLDQSERAQVAGFVINKFRGDFDLLRPGIKMFEEMVDRPVLGTIPFFRDIFVDEEDGLSASQANGSRGKRPSITISVVGLPRMSNFTDFKSLEHEADVRLTYAFDVDDLQDPDVVILPGTKNTMTDLHYLKERGLFVRISGLAERGTMIFGICGGYQMMGQSIADPHGVESSEGEVDGFAFFNMKTEMAREKTTQQRRTQLNPGIFTDDAIDVTGYEIHMGRSTLMGDYQPLFAQETLGIASDNRQILGTYLHGIFDNDGFRLAFLNFLRCKKGLQPKAESYDYQEFQTRQLDKLADLFRCSLNMERLYRIVDGHFH